DLDLRLVAHQQGALAPAADDERRADQVGMLVILVGDPRHGNVDRRARAGDLDNAGAVLRAADLHAWRNLVVVRRDAVADLERAAVLDGEAAGRPGMLGHIDPAAIDRIPTAPVAAIIGDDDLRPGPIDGGGTVAIAADGEIERGDGTAIAHLEIAL